MRGTGKHILESFNTALDELEEGLLMMSSLAERSLRNGMRGLCERDDELCTAVIADDEEIDTLEKQIDNDGIELLRRFQPFASDLRAVVTAMKINGNLERIADQAVNIARKARILNRNPMLDEVHLLEPMFDLAMEMYLEALRAYAENDANLALSIRLRDKTLDDMNRQLADRLTELMASTPSRITEYLNLILISRHIERVGDHAKSIAEEVVYAVSAEDIRHTRE